MRIHLTKLVFSLIVINSCQSQTSKSTTMIVGGPCEGCEAIFEYGNISLTSTTTLPDFDQTEPKLKVTGKVYQRDGETPAADVILYVYHTNRKGIYATKGNEEGWARSHGYIRGWIKTNKNGHYTFHTFRPAAYPNGSEAEHIHLTIKEPDKNEYYVESFFFDDDPTLTPDRRKKLQQRGGSGIVSPLLNDGIYIIERDIILGLNIPNY